MLNEKEDIENIVLLFEVSGLILPCVNLGWLI